MTTKIEKLTPEQEAVMGKVRDEWINFALNSGDELDTKAATEGIAWLYQMANYKKPVCVFVDSPLAVQYAVPIALDLLKGKASGSQVRSQVYSQVGSQVYSQVRSQVDSQVGSQVRSQVYSQVDSQVGLTRRLTRRFTRSSQVGSQYYNITYESLGWASGWVAYIEFFERIGVVKHSDFKKYKRFLKSGVFYGVFLDGLAVMCRRPQAVRRDEQNRLHNDQLPAIEWRDGYKLHFLDGVCFQEDELQKITSQEMTLKDITRASMGADKSAVAQKYLRPDRLLEACKAKLIHTGIKGTRLYEVKNFMGTSTTQYCMRMKHPTIEREYIEWVHPDIGKQADADLCQAAAWRDKDGDHIPVEDYLAAVEA